MEQTNADTEEQKVDEMWEEHLESNKNPPTTGEFIKQIIEEVITERPEEC